ncbi:ornithine cyclodeaminase family protein [bacterium]|nr:ornithine cyclodeaminase family protein [bacterium]
MQNLIELETIKAVLPQIDLIKIIEDGFEQYSKGKVVVPPVGELVFEDPPGEAHIKYGYIKDDDYYVIKIASGFYNNPVLDLPSSQGLMLVFSQKTGVLDAILLDDGYLTDIRTAAAGAVAAKYLAPDYISAIGIIGAGIQARQQLHYLKSITSCKIVKVWTREMSEQTDYMAHFKNSGYNITFVTEPYDIAAQCNLIVTTTPSKVPLLRADDIRPGTHITAVGSDTSEKIELDPAILHKADIVVSDSLAQSKTRGEIYRAVEAGTIQRNTVIELGNVIASGKKARQNDQQITIADLTGVAVQDIQIAKAVYEQVCS